MRKMLVLSLCSILSFGVGAKELIKEKKVDFSHAKNHVHWSYEGEGAEKDWASLSNEYKLCNTGKVQSPIDIRDNDTIKVNNPEIKFDYKETMGILFDNGHTIQYKINDSYNNRIIIQGKQYDLIQFHFHKPSEEKINGKRYALSIHLVHQSYDDKSLAVVGLLVEPGEENKEIQKLWNNLPLDKKIEVQFPFDAASLLPKTKNHYAYMGSLTTPPCSEGVLWIMMKEPIKASEEQIKIFGKLYNNNARSIQAINNRLIKEDK